MEENNELGKVVVEENNAKKSKAPIIVGVIAIILVLVAVIWGVVNASSNTEKFVENTLNIFEVFGDVEAFDLEDGKVVADIAINPSLINSMGSEDALPLSRFAFVSEFNVKENDFSGKLYLDVDSTELVTLQYAKNGDLLGFMVNDLMNENLVLKNENLKALAEKLGMSEEEIDMIPDKLSIDDMMETVTQDEESKEKVVEILEKYQKPLENVVEDLFVTTKNQEITVGDVTVNTKKTSLPLTEKKVSELLKAMLVVAKDDEDLYNLLKEQNASFEYDSFADWQEEWPELIAEVDELIASGDDTETAFEISTYTKGKSTIAVEFSAPSENMIVRLATINNNVKFTVVMDTEEVNFVLTTENTKDELKGNLVLAMDLDGVEMNMDVLNYSVKYSKDAVVEQIDLTKDFLLNDKTQEEIDAKFNEIKKNIFKYLSIIVDKAPESLMSILGLGTSTDDYDSITGYDSDYIEDGDTDFYFSDDDDYDFTLDFDYDEE